MFEECYIMALETEMQGITSLIYLLVVVVIGNAIYDTIAGVFKK